VDDHRLAQEARVVGAVPDRSPGDAREVRGRGLMIGVGLEDGIDANEVSAAALEAGLVINVPEPGSLRLLPPLVTGEDEVERSTTLLAGAIARQS